MRQLARRRARGYSMTEILVTMLIMSVGLLGIAGIMVSNLKNNHGAYARTQASVLVTDIVERMRANRSAAQASPSPYALAIDAVPDVSAGVAGADLDAWRRSVVASLPSGRGAVAFDSATGNVTVTVEWNDTRASGDGRTIGLENQQFVFETRL